MKTKISNALSLALIAAMLITSVALADEVFADGDNVAPVAQNPLNLGNVCLGDTASGPVLLAIRRQANPNSDTVFANSSTVTISVASVTGAGLSATMGADNTVILPSNWVTASTGTMSINTANSTVSLNTTGLPLGLYTGTVQYDGTGNNSAPPPATITRNGSLAVNANIVNCDTTPPVITRTITGTLGSNGWYTSNVTVDWTVTDPESSFTMTGCVDTTISIDTSGTTLSCSATSAGGTSSDSVTIKRDATAPTGVTGAPNRAADHGTWYNSAVDIVFTGNDATSGIAGCTTTTYSGPDGSSVTVNGSCTDNAGNTSAPVASSAFNYDGTAPTAVLSVTAGTAGANGWYTSDVTVHTSGMDAVSGVTCTADQFQTTETTGAVFNGSCTNGAGLTTNAAALTVKLDKTGPSASLAATAGTLGANGWYTTDVTVSTSGSDSISSPVTCSADQYQTIETTGTTFNGSCTNDAGLTTNASSLTIKLDKTGPLASLAVTAGTLGANGWYTSDVTVSTSGSDSISSPVICSADQYQTTETTGAVFNGSCTNDAGLTTNASSLTVKLDKTAPSASLAVTAGTLGANGWYTSDVTVSTSGSDSISSPVTCSADQYQTTETAGTAFNGSCTNDAGLSTNAAPLTVKLDKTAPGLTWNGSIDNGDSFYFGLVPAIPTCTATDALSGPGTCSVAGYGTALGSHTLTAIAYDLAGNSYSEQRTYSVLAWTLNGFFQPVDMNSVLNTVRNGSTVPLKFRIFAGSTELKDVAYIDTLMYAQIQCNLTAPQDDIETTATGGTSLRYDLTGGQFIFNWKTPSGTAGKCFRVTMTTDDGSSLVAFFKMK